MQKKSEVNKRERMFHHTVNGMNKARFHNKKK